jgi:geranylgeranyl pyrophosphate synthase
LPRSWGNGWVRRWCPTGRERSPSRCYQQRPADCHQEDTGAAELVSGPIGDDAEHAEALELLRSSAALERATEVLREYVDRARRRLDGVPEGPVRKALAALCEYVVPRTG